MDLATLARKVAQRKCSDKTMAEMVKMDAKLASTLEGGLYGTRVKLQVALIVMSNLSSFQLIRFPRFSENRDPLGRHTNLIFITLAHGLL